jgi:predicted dehydrogenase
MNRIKFGVLGVSNHFYKRIALPLLQTDKSQLYAIASRDKSKAEEAASEYAIPLVCDSYQQLIDNPEVEAIYIPLPNHLHAEWTIKALHAGKPVLCEKPLAMNAAEAEKVVQLSETSGVPLMEGFMYRFHPLWKHARDIIRSRQIGTVNAVHTTFTYNNPSPTNIRNIKAFGGGALMDIGCYAISAARFIFGREPGRVLATMDSHPEFGTDRSTSALLQFGNATATFFVSTTSEPFQKVEIIGTAGTITVHVPFNTYVDTPSTITVSTGQGSREVQFPVCDPYGIMLDAFSQSLLQKQPVPTPLEDAVNNMKVIDAVRKSALSGQWEEL